MNILLIGEYSGLHNELKNALIAQGHNVTLAASNDFWKKLDVDISLGHGSNIYSYKARQFLLPLLKLREFQGYDIVHLINFYTLPRSPKLNLFFIKYLKENNNVITISGAGDDPFFVRFSEETLRYSPIPSHEKYDRKALYYMRGERHLEAMHESLSYIDGVIPIMYEYYSTFCKAGYTEKVSKPIPIPINCNKIEFIENTVSTKLVFFHGLNRRGFKGTFLIEKSFADLEKKYPNDVKCVIEGNLPFKQYMELLKTTNISVDQTFSYSLAMNALYSMAQGKLVIGGVEPESAILYDGVLPPAYNAQPETSALLKVFEQVLDQRNRIPEISKLSRAFVEEKHSPELVAKEYIQFWQNILNKKQGKIVLDNQISRT